ncbi:SARP family transcriptional regulator [Nakamurella silvestris]|nr:SARP family transcriptional regulator [Nakamurella silvestris]
MPVEFGVLGPVTAWDTSGESIRLKGPRHRSLLARLLIAHGRAVPLGSMVDALWADPPADPVGTIRTFVADLRRALEPNRTPRTPSRLLVTVGSGYQLKAEPSAVDADRFERAVLAAGKLAPDPAYACLDAALSYWRGPAYADVAEEPWARNERIRLGEMRLLAVELRGQALLDLGRPAQAAADLDGYVDDHPWRERGWLLLALALYRAGRQAEALDVLRRARTRLADELGLDPGIGIQQLEADILRQADHLSADLAATDQVWTTAAAIYGRTVPAGTRARLRATVDLLRNLAVTGGSGLESARTQRSATVRAAEEVGDPVLTARVIGAYDVPAVWSRSDDPAQAAELVSAARQALGALRSADHDTLRARLSATIAVESRGLFGTSGPDAARVAEALARRLDDPAVLAFALNGRFLQSFHRTGLAAERDALGAELIEISSRHGLVTHELLGRLVRMQASAALGDLDEADRQAAAADHLAAEYESPLVAVFTQWYRATRLAMTGTPPADVALAYRAAAARLDDAGMPGLRHGLLPLALLGLQIQHSLPVVVDPAADWGPYLPWARPHLLLADGRIQEAAAAVEDLPEPPPDHLVEALWCLAGTAAVTVQNRDTMRRALNALRPAADEQAGAGSGMLTLGPVARYLAELERALAE